MFLWLILMTDSTSSYKLLFLPSFGRKKSKYGVTKQRISSFLLINEETITGSRGFFYHKIELMVIQKIFHRFMCQIWRPYQNRWRIYRKTFLLWLILIQRLRLLLQNFNDWSIKLMKWKSKEKHSLTRFGFRISWKIVLSRYLLFLKTHIFLQDPCRNDNTWVLDSET